jgi:hypothetical protein
MLMLINLCPNLALGPRLGVETGGALPLRPR